uniref:Protein krueppel n=1 Tax=Biomphalaria glabrata TaxID=6526 RepID=A0A2C9JEJ6_BIOGL
MAEKQNMTTLMLQWSDHSNKLLEKLYMQWKSVSFCDLCIVSSNKHLETHAWVLSAFSPRVASYVSKCRSSLEGRKLAPPYIMEVQYNYEVMSAIITALYTGVFSPPSDFLPETYAAVKWFDISELKELLENHFDDDTLLLPEDLQLSIRVTDNNTFCDAVVKLEKLSPTEDSNDIDLQNCIVTTSFPDLKVLNELNSDAGQMVRRTARKRKSLPCRYDGEIFIIGPPKKEKPSSKSFLGVSEVTHNDSTSISSQLDIRLKKLSADDINISHTPLKIKEEECPSMDTDAGQDPNDLTVSEEHVDSISQSSVTIKMNKKCRDKTTENMKRKQEKTKRTKIAEVTDKLILSTTKRKKDKNLNLSSVTRGTHKTTTIIEEVKHTDPIGPLLSDLDAKKCEKCYITLPNLEIYNQHINDHPEFSCQDCGQIFYRKYDCTRHQRNKHSGRPWLKCVNCTFQASTEIGLKRHFQELHGDDKPFVCTVEGCGYRSSRYTEMGHHLRTHSDAKSFYCEKCGQGFALYRCLVYHQRSCYRLQPFLCDICGQGFNHQQSMLIHKSCVHFGVKSYTCKVCSHSFGNHSNLRRHMRIHNNSFPYPCPVCDEKFRHSNSLKMHLSVKHKGEGDFRFLVKNSQPWNKLGGQSYKRRSKNLATDSLTTSAETVVGKAATVNKKNSSKAKGNKTSASNGDIVESRQRRSKRSVRPTSQKYKDYVMPGSDSDLSESNKKSTRKRTWDSNYEPDALSDRELLSSDDQLDFDHGTSLTDDIKNEFSCDQ